jgi:hypothetical protein
MLNVLFRRAARLAHAPLFRVVSSCLCAWAVWAPAASAAEPQSDEQSVTAPFKHYQGWRDEPLQDWRAVNDRVGEVGGWRTYLRESESQPKGDGAGQDPQNHHGHNGH